MNENLTIKNILSIEKYSKFEKEKKKERKKQIFSLFQKCVILKTFFHYFMLFITFKQMDIKFVLFNERI